MESCVIISHIKCVWKLHKNSSWLQQFSGVISNISKLTKMTSLSVLFKTQTSLETEKIFCASFSPKINKKFNFDPIENHYEIQSGSQSKRIDEIVILRNGILGKWCHLVNWWRVRWANGTIKIYAMGGP